MVLIEAIKGGKPNGTRILPPIVIYEGLEYSKAIKELLYGNSTD